MNTKEMIEVLQAFERGEKVETKLIGGNTFWVDKDTHASFNFMDFEYRIAPKPKKQVKLLAWFDGENFFYLKEGVKPKFESQRVKTHDQIIEVEDE